MRVLVGLAVCLSLVGGGCSNAPAPSSVLATVEQSYILAGGVEAKVLPSLPEADRSTMKDLDNQVFTALSNAQTSIKAGDSKQSQLVEAASAALTTLLQFLNPKVTQ